MKTGIGMAMMVAGLFAGCGDDGGGTDSAPSGGPCDPLMNARGNPVACVTGALVDQAGDPVVGIAVGACNKDLCIKTNTDADGRYTIQGLDVAPMMMKVFGIPKGYMMTNWFQETKPGEMTVLDRDVILIPRPSNAVALPESGGSATVADGKLEISAEDGSLSYPIGETEQIEATMIDPEDLPPFDSEPWAGKEKKTLVFVVNPFPVDITGPIDMTVKGAGAAAGTPYRLYAANHITGVLEEGGSLVANDAGDLVLQPGGALANLTTLIIVPN